MFGDAEELVQAGQISGTMLARLRRDGKERS